MSEERLYTAGEVADAQTSEARLVLAGYRSLLREEFLRLLTVDSETRDRRRKEHNQAIFDPTFGYAVFTNTDLNMVMEKFDRAVKEMR